MAADEKPDHGPAVLKISFLDKGYEKYKIHHSPPDIFQPPQTPRVVGSFNVEVHGLWGMLPSGRGCEVWQVFQVHAMQFILQVCAR